MKIICDDKIPFLQGVFEPYAEVLYRKGSDFQREEVLDADALIIRTRTKCDEALLQGSKVKVIASATIGFDHIDTSWCESHGIIWANAPGCNSSSVRQWVGSVLCAMSHRLAFSLKDKTLGIVGVGHVGSKVDELAKTLGMKTLLCDPPRAEKKGKGKFVDLRRIINESDIISLHVPLSEDTYHLFSEKELNELHAGQILINSSRGEVVDEKELKNCLKGGFGIHAVLDVWEHEPEIDRDLLELVEIGTPHIAGYSADGKAEGTAQAVRAVSKVLGIKELEDFVVCDIPPSETPAYDVLSDDKALRAHPEDFEKLRGDYPIRREPFFKN